MLDRSTNDRWKLGKKNVRLKSSSRLRLMNLSRIPFFRAVAFFYNENMMSNIL